VKRESDSRGALIARRLGSTVVWTLPVLMPIVLAIVSLLIAMPEDSETDDVLWGFIGIPAVALSGAWARAVQSERLGDSQSAAWLNALGAAAIGVVIGYVLWWQAVEETCHGRYECPF
jgi:peptidoglycan/LPS O-acetylase OafA/YrhL